MKLSSLAYRVHGQPMFKVLSKVKSLEAQGKSIIHFEIGEPDFDTPKHIINACHKSLLAGHTHYTDSMGNMDFRKIICKNNLHTRGFEPSPDQVLVVSGANSIIYYAVAAVANPGDEVIISDPCFPTYSSVLTMCGVKAVTVPLKEENKFCIDPADLRKSITDKTRMIIINSPNNPTGSVMSKSTQIEIANIARENGIYLLCDEVYARMNYSDEPFYSPSILDGCKEFTFVLNGFSKTFAMTGWRLGVCIGPKVLIEKMSLMLQTIISCVSPFIQDAGIAAITGPQDDVHEMVSIYRKRRDILVKGLNELDGISCLSPEGAFYVFANIKQTGKTCEEIADILLEKAGVAVLPGTDFGSGGAGYIRLCYANSEENIVEGLHRIKEALTGTVNSSGRSEAYGKTELPKKRVTDYIADYLYTHGIDTVFTVTGGGSIFLTDGLAADSRISVISNHHEQASAMAAVSYAKYKGLGCAYFTTGCGSTNALTGLLHAWQDSTPCVFISGQAKTKETIRNSGLALRQFGVQEADIVSLVEPITKYSVMVTSPQDIKYHLDKAFHLAKSGRPGPVWLDIPMDVQSAEIVPGTLRGYEPVERDRAIIDFETLVGSLKESKRPVIIAGQGIRLAGKCREFGDFVHRHKIPVVCSRMGLDVMPSNDSLYIGRIGNKGTRPANFAVQNADFILAIGSRLSVSSTGHEYELFAPHARLAVVDIDPVEHRKNTVKIDQFIRCDIGDFFAEMPDFDFTTPQEWLDRTAIWKQKYPVFNPAVKPEHGVDLYCFMNALSECLAKDDIVVTDAGSAVYAPAQGIELRFEEQRYITSGAQAEMGFTLPGVIGACKAAKRRVIGITGDGSFQMNLQELQTIIYNNMPVKIFVWNNNGYLSIRATQQKFFNGRMIGTDSSNGLSFPDFAKISNAYGIKYIQIKHQGELKEKIREAFDFNGPVICDVACDPNQEIIPSVSSKVLPDGKIVSCPIDDMYPFLSREELLENRFVELIITPPPPIK
jgi:acetolactate synthase-1/2/3 large subunit